MLLLLLQRFRASLPSSLFRISISSFLSFFPDPFLIVLFLPPPPPLFHPSSVSLSLSLSLSPAPFLPGELSPFQNQNRTELAEEYTWGQRRRRRRHSREKQTKRCAAGRQAGRQWATTTLDEAGDEKCMIVKTPLESCIICDASCSVSMKENG